MSSNNIGKLFQAEDAKVLEWEIAKFSLSNRVGTVYRSSNFVFSDACWNLCIFPNGQSQSVGYIGLFLYLLDAKCAHSIDATLCLKDVKGKEKYGKNLTQTWIPNTKLDNWGHHKFCERSEVTSRKSKLLPDDVLTVRCTLKILNRRPVRVSLFERLLKVSRNMKAILKGGKRSDVVLKLNGRDFPAHMAILETGSEVFQAMFIHNMAENRTGEVSIVDVEPDVFEEVLSYMYSGRVDNLCVDNVFQLYEAADKYALDELKELCTTFMMENISVDLFGKIVVMADKHKETELLEFAKDFFRKNSVGIVESETLRQQFVSDVAFQLFVSYTKDNAEETLSDVTRQNATEPRLDRNKKTLRWPIMMREKK